MQATPTTNIRLMKNKKKNPFMLISNWKTNYLIKK